MNNYYSTMLGQVLKDWHESKDISIYAIAKKLKVNRQPLDDLESGRSSAPENALRYLVWVSKHEPQIWNKFMDSLQEKPEEEIQRMLDFQRQEQRAKDKAEAARKAKEMEALKSEAIIEAKRQLTAYNEDKIKELEKTINDSVQANMILQQHNQQLQIEIERLQQEATKPKKRSFWRRLFRLG